MTTKTSINTHVLWVKHIFYLHTSYTKLSAAMLALAPKITNRKPLMKDTEAQASSKIIVVVKLK
jgi:hypothetical protein